MNAEVWEKELEIPVSGEPQDIAPFLMALPFSRRSWALQSPKCPQRLLRCRADVGIRSLRGGSQMWNRTGTIPLARQQHSQFNLRAPIPGL